MRSGQRGVFAADKRESASDQHSARPHGHASRIAREQGRGLTPGKVLFSCFCAGRKSSEKTVIAVSSPGQCVQTTAPQRSKSAHTGDDTCPPDTEMWRRSPTEDSRRAGAWRCDAPPRALGHTGRHQGGEAAGNGSRGAGRRAHARQILEVRSRQIPLWLRVSARTSGVLLRHEVLDLTRLVDARPRQARVLPRQLHPVERLQVVEPHRLGVVLCEEDLADPLLVAALEEAQHKGGHTCSQLEV